MDLRRVRRDVYIGSRPPVFRNPPSVILSPVLLSSPTFRLQAFIFRFTLATTHEDYVAAGSLLGVHTSSSSTANVTETPPPHEETCS
jgi:hypothetical protein